MAELIQQYKRRLTKGNGVEYTAQAWGDRNEDGTWKGWFEFRPLDDVYSKLQTREVTAQPKRLDLAYWASRVAHDSLEEAFEAAREVPDAVAPK